MKPEVSARCSEVLERWDLENKVSRAVNVRQMQMCQVREREKVDVVQVKRVE